jgi:GDP-L-fucose synthase
MRVGSLLTGPLEPTNEAYAVAKIAGIKLCQAYHQQYGANMLTVIPADVFGPGDYFGLEDAHVVAALIRKMHEAKITAAAAVDVWGSGAARRDFIFAEDVADAAIFLMENFSGAEPINVGAGSSVSIKELAELIKAVVGYDGLLQFDASQPEGVPVKVLDSSELRALGWQPKTSLRMGLEKTYRWFLETTKDDLL